jgi:formylglycine-generating enzyme required for sulfatase activity
MKKILCLFVFAVLITGLTMVVPTHANHIQVGIPTLTGQNTTSHYVDVQFDLSWDNSWRCDIAGTGQAAPYNYDAAWLFVKYKVTGGDGKWYHATLSIIAGNHTAPTGSTITPSSGDGKAVFIYRNANTTGSNDWNNVKLRWEYGTDTVADGANVTVKVFGIEMVYIPAGNFYVGDGSSHGTLRQTGSNIPQQITTTAVVVKCEETPFDDDQLKGNGILVDGDDGIDKDGTAGPVDNANYPTGYTAFYCMKQEVSQGEYADFLNTLTGTQDGNRYYSTTSYRYTIGGSAGSHSAGVPDRACNYLSWMDGCAYMDWAGLRPMTELEFEKVCRGPSSAVAGEYAWGNANVDSSAYTLTNDGLQNATVSNAATDTTGNMSYSITDGSTDGPLRCGIFATGSSTRIEAGAGYYGVLELSGNLWEPPVTLGNSSGRSFEGTHGDGSLSDNGHATNSDWPGESGGEVTGATGSGFRGGYWALSADRERVSDRGSAAYTYTGRSYGYGSRGVRSAP